MHPSHAPFHQSLPHPDTGGIEVAAQRAGRSVRAASCLRRATRGTACARVPARDRASGGTCGAISLRPGHRGGQRSDSRPGHHDALGLPSSGPRVRRRSTSPHQVRRAWCFDQLPSRASEADVASKLYRVRAQERGGAALRPDVPNATRAKEIQEQLQQAADSYSRPSRHHREPFRRRTCADQVALEAGSHAGRPPADARGPVCVGGGPSP